jgi:hypothetical protein
VVPICNFFTKSALHYGLSGFWGLYVMMYMLLYMEICTDVRALCRTIILMLYYTLGLDAIDMCCVY